MSQLARHTSAYAPRPHAARYNANITNKNTDDDERIVEELNRLGDQLIGIEHSVDSAVEDARLVILSRLQSERDRVVNEARLVIGEERRRLKEGQIPMRRQLSFSLNPKFINAMKKLDVFSSSCSTDLETEPLFLASRVHTVVERPISPEHRRHELPYSIYESMRVLAVIHGNDTLGCVIENPTCVACLIPAGSNSCAAFSHNNYRISIVSAGASLVSTFMLCHDDKLPLFFRKIIQLVADDCGRLFLMEEGKHDTIYAFDPGNLKPNQSLVVPTKFAHLEDLKMSGGKIQGIALSFSPGRLIYAATGMEIRAISLDDGSERFRCKLPPSQQFATTLQCVQTPAVDWSIHGSEAKSFLVYTTWNGSELYPSPIFSRSGRVETHEKFLLAEDGPAPGNVSHVVGAGCDLEGNLLVVEQGNRRVQVFSASGRALCTFAPSLGEQFSTCGAFDPRGVAVISSMQLDVTKHRRPVVVLADVGRNSVLLFAPRFK